MKLMRCVKRKILVAVGHQIEMLLLNFHYLNNIEDGGVLIG